MNANKISKQGAMITPRKLMSEIPMTNGIIRNITQHMRTATDIVHGENPKMMVMVGPCSIHDKEEALEYASKLKSLSSKVSDKIFIVMRVYLEKPRTVGGWKGLVHQPHVHYPPDIRTGVRTGRELLRDINKIGLPIVTEFLDPLIAEYVSDFVTTGTIGARTVESQIHREFASGIGMPIGFKNGTGGSIQNAVQAIQASAMAHSYLKNNNGKVEPYSSAGNPDGYLILRGGGPTGTNYDELSISKAERLLREQSINTRIVIDCSHGNALKDHRNQALAFESIISQRLNGNNYIVGAMLESNLQPGSQPIEKQLKRGVSITDSCLGFEETERLILSAHSML